MAQAQNTDDAVEPWCRAIADTIRDVIYCTRIDGTVEYLNAAFERLTGWSRREWIGRSFVGLVHPDDRSTALDRLMRLREGEELPACEMRWLRRDGGYFFGEHISSRRLDAGRPAGIVGILRDVSERRRISESLRASEARYRHLVDGTPAAVMLTTFDGGIVWCNAAALKLFGYDFESSAELSSKSVVDFYASPAERQNLVERYRRDGFIAPMELEMRRRDGSPVWVLGGGSTVLDADGNTLIQATLIDVTRRRVLEERQRQVEKMEAIGRLAGGIAHDFNNILMVILTRADETLQRLPPDHDVRDAVATIHDVAGRAADLTRQLLTFSRERACDVEVLDVRNVVQDMGRLLLGLVGEGIALNLDLGSDPSPVLIPRSQVEQVVMNLVVNARDAMPHGGILDVHVAQVSCETAALNVGRPMAAHAYAAITVRDNGHGMDEAVQRRVFEPFFTTRAAQGGTGFGLSTTYAIVDRAGGAITINSARGRGTSFTVYLPVAQPPTVNDAGAPVPCDSFPAIGPAIVLVAEDHADVRDAISDLLGRLGHRALTAASAADALDIVRDRGQEVDLFMTDLVLPDMPGWQLASIVRETCPHAPVLFVSAYPDEHLFGSAEGNVLQKPFSADALSAKIRQLLNPAGRPRNVSRP